MYLYTYVNSIWHHLKVSINFSVLQSFFFTIADLLSACTDIHSLNHEKPISVVFVSTRRELPVLARGGVKTSQ